MNSQEQSHVGEQHGAIGVVFALRIEAGGFVDTLDDVISTRNDSVQTHVGVLTGIPITVVETGNGCSRARVAMQQMLDRHKPTWVISAGFAGSLATDLQRGDFLVADALVDEDGNCLHVEHNMDPVDTPGLHVGQLLTLDRVIQKSDERLLLAEKHQTVAVDMESYVVADVCRHQGVRFLSVRVIFDGVHDEIPQEVAYLLRQESTAARLGAAAGAVFRRPSSARDLWRLRERALRDSGRLAQFLKGIVQQLHGS